MYEYMGGLVEKWGESTIGEYGYSAVGAVVGAVVFTLVTWLYSTIQDRLSSGPAAKASAFFSAVSLYMASQCFIGMIL
jgi:hypothetical protein